MEGIIQPSEVKNVVPYIDEISIPLADHTEEHLTASPQGVIWVNARFVNFDETWAEIIGPDHQTW